MDYALKLNQFEELNYSELMAVDGGANLDGAIGAWGVAFSIMFSIGAATGVGLVVLGLGILVCAGFWAYGGYCLFG